MPVSTRQPINLLQMKRKHRLRPQDIQRNSLQKLNAYPRDRLFDYLYVIPFSLFIH